MEFLVRVLNKLKKWMYISSKVKSIYSINGKGQYKL